MIVLIKKNKDFKSFIFLLLNMPDQFSGNLFPFGFSYFIQV
jgi:hypothetical protein